MRYMKIPVGQCKCGCGKTTKIANRTIKLLGHVIGQPKPFVQSHWLKYRPVVGHRFCPRCKKYRKHDAFQVNKSKSPYCAKCRRGWARERYRKNLSQARIDRRIYMLNLKKRALAGYSEDGVPRCSCCKVEHIEFLSVDHIAGDRRAHFAKDKLRCGQSLHSWIIKNKFPSFLRVLCMNCNTSYGHRGYCPHFPVENPMAVVKMSRRTL